MISYPKQINILSIIAFSGIVIFLYFDNILHIYNQLQNNGMWRLFVLPIAVYMVWHKRSYVSSYSIKPALLFGSVCIFCAFFFQIVGHITLLSIFSEISIAVMIIGFIGLSKGMKYVAFFLWPILYILCMTSILSIVIPSFAIHLQHISSVISSEFLNIIGLPVIRDGLFIRLPTRILKVGYWCSGTNQLITLLAIAIPTAYIRHNQFTPRVIIILSVLPITLFFNSIRIILIAIWNYHAIRQSIHGPFEILLIPIIHPFAIALVFLISFVLKKIFKTDIKTAEIALTQSKQRLPSTNYSYVFLLVILLFSVYFLLTTRFISKDLSKLNKFDNTLINFKGWTGEKINNTKNVFKSIRPDFQQHWLFKKDSTDNEVILYLAYFLSQNSIKKCTNNTYEWLSNQENTITKYHNSIGDLQYKLLTDEIEKKKKIVLYYYFIDNIIFTNKYDFQWKQMRNLITQRRNDGGIMVLYKNIEPSKNAHQKEVSKTLDIFARQTHILLKDFK